MTKLSRVKQANQRSAATFVLIASLTCAVVLAIASPASAGGFQISVETPTQSNDPQLKEVVLIARTYGCLQPADAKLTATAEGLVGANRRSVPLELRSIGSGVYAIKKQWPSDGKWVLALTGAYNGMISSVLVELGPNGGVLSGTRLKPGYPDGVHAKGVRRTWQTADIEAALKSADLKTSGISVITTEDSGTSNFGGFSWMIAGLGASALTAGVVTVTRRGRNNSNDQ
jgi:hypothetical protein